MRIDDIMKITHRSHGIPFNRKGSCNQCGACHCDTINGGDPCVHFSWVGNLASCDIYETRDQVCTACSNNPDSVFYNKFDPGADVTHQFCVDYPNHPFMANNRDGKCAYTWTQLTEGGQSDNTPWPFLILRGNNWQ